MSCENDKDIRIITKYSTFPGEVPTIPLSNDHTDGTWLPTDLYVGETFYNVADGKSWFRAENGIIQIGATGGTLSFIGDFIPTSGGTATGPIYAPTFSSIGVTTSNIYTQYIYSDTFEGTFFGDGSGLTGIDANWLGGTISNPVQFNSNFIQNGLTELNGIISSDSGTINIQSDINATGYGVSASYFYGDGSFLTNLPAGTYSDIYTISATLSGNEIVFDRNDVSGAYRVDLTPILGSMSISSLYWDDTTNSLNVLLNDGTIITEEITTFQSLTSLTSISANDFYGGNFYGTFTGTFSDDIYTTTATLYGTDLVFDRTDGFSYSVDLSSLSSTASGATQTLGQTLIYGNTTEGNDILLSGSIFGGGNSDTIRLYGNTMDSGFTFEYPGYGSKWSPKLYTSGSDGRTTIGVFSEEDIILQSAQAYGSVNEYARVDINTNNIEISTNDLVNLTGVTHLITATGHTITGFSGFEGIKYATDYSADFTNRSLVDKEYVDNILDLTQTSGNITDIIEVDVDNNNFGTGIKSEDSSTGELVKTVIKPYETRTNAVASPTINTEFIQNPYEFYIITNRADLGQASSIVFDSNSIIVDQQQGGIEYNGDYSATFTNRSLVDKEYVDNAIAGATGGIGATPSLSGVLAVGNTMSGWIEIYDGNTNGIRTVGGTNSSIIFAPTRLSLSTADGTGNSSGLSLYKNGELKLTATNGVDGCEFLMSDSGTVYLDGLSQAGIQYASDYSANYTLRSLVDKEYVDNAVSIPNLSSVLAVGNTTGNKFIVSNTNYGIQENATNKGQLQFTSTAANLTNTNGTNTSTIAAYKTGQIRLSNSQGAYLDMFSNGNVQLYSNGTTDIISQSYSRLYHENTTFRGGATTYTSGGIGETVIFIADNVNGLTGSQTSYKPNLITTNAINGSNETNIFQTPTGFTFSGPTGFKGIEYQSDYSANYTNRSLIDKGYLDTRIAGLTGSGGGTASSLSNVLLIGNTASTSIDMNGNNITEIGSIGTTTGETVEMINVLNMTLLNLMYNT